MENFIKIVGGVVVIVLIVVVSSLIGAYPVMLLWNWLMPYLFELPLIDFWQAFGILVLFGMLFKSSSTSTQAQKK